MHGQKRLGELGARIDEVLAVVEHDERGVVGEVPDYSGRQVTSPECELEADCPLVKRGCYNATMSSATTVKVSSRGQMSLPASARHRWGLEGGGEIGVIDLDGALLLVPGGIDAAKKALRAAIASGRYERSVRDIEDPDLAN